MDDRDPPQCSGWSSGLASEVAGSNSARCWCNAQARVFQFRHFPLRRFPFPRVRVRVRVTLPSSEVGNGEMGNGEVACHPQAYTKMIVADAVSQTFLKAVHKFQFDFVIVYCNDIFISAEAKQAADEMAVAFGRR